MRGVPLTDAGALVPWVVALAAISPVVSADTTGPQWSYSGEHGPEYWGTQDASFAICGTGQRQSPIDIRYASPKALPPIEFAYRPIALEVTDTGHSIQVDAPTGSGGITIGGEHYDLLQFHFHRPSEERIHGRRYSMVAHLVHKNGRGDLAVVAVLIRKGADNAFLAPVFDHFPAAGTSESTVPGVTVDLEKFLPKQPGYYTFEGSLTTPPCSEHVRWFVLKSAVEASPAQLGQFATRYPNNARPTQPLNGRKVQQTVH